MKVLDNSVPERVLDFSLPPTLTKGILIKKQREDEDLLIH